MGYMLICIWLALGTTNLDFSIILLLLLFDYFIINYLK